MAVAGSYEIALCQWGVLGNRIVVPDEVVIEPKAEVVKVPPTFAENLQPISVILDEASTWVLPEVIVGSAALDEVLVIPNSSLNNVIDYDAQT